MAVQPNFTNKRSGSNSPSASLLDDEELLKRVLDRNDRSSADAFGLLLSRHGPMVLGVGRQVLGNEHDAEDIFQATFLVLSRNAASIKNKRALAGWLYAVANRLAMRLKMGAARCRSLERGSAVSRRDRYRFERGSEDLRPVLHEEVNRLPDWYRIPVVLCYMEARTNEEAAALLNWPVGTVKSRLSRAREILRTRLMQSGPRDLDLSLHGPALTAGVRCRFHAS
jgi:RNA polymerase sigma factor (sigma-70 family)